MCYTASATFIKLSLLTFFIRLSTGAKFLALVYVVVFIVISFGISSIATVLLQCLPLSALWDAEKMATAHCIRVTDFYYANAAINITTDVMILLLPLKILWGLHMPLRQRISLCGLFGLGGLYVTFWYPWIALLEVWLTMSIGPASQVSSALRRLIFSTTPRTPQSIWSRP